MKRILIALITSMAVLLLPLHVLAGKGGEKGPGDRAYERANDNASFKRGGHDDDYDRHQHRDRHDDHDDDDRDHDRDRDRDRDHDDDERPDSDKKQKSKEKKGK